MKRIMNNTKNAVFSGIIALLLMSLAGADVFAQRNPADVPDSKGTDFRVVFIPNFHSPRLDIYDSLGLFITALETANVNIRYRLRNGTVREDNITVNPDNIATIKYHFSLLELRGETFDGRIGFPQGDNERVSALSMHITSDNDVTIYGLNQAHYSSDAFLILPTDALGDEYVIPGYPSNALIDITGMLSNMSTPSQFAVVALEDNTEIVITPRAPTFRNGLARQTVTLQEGEVYLVQADMNVFNLTHDLSGSHVKANKHVAVFTGHQRALVPYDTDALQSRDGIYEQVPPLDAWGRTVLITPYLDSPTMTRVGTDIYRVYVALDRTTISVNGEVVGTFNSGEFYQAPLVREGVVTSDQPILVTQYRRTGTLRSDRVITRSGDPFMMIIPPAEQYAKQYKFINVQGLQGIQTAAGDVRGTEPAFNEHYITVIAADTALTEIELDGELLNPNIFRRIQGSDYMFANIKLGEGQHEIESPDNIGVYVYGYGPANSYGYIAGGEFRKLDRFTPEVFVDFRCFGLDGQAFDTLELDTRIGEVFAGDQTENVTFEVDDFVAYADSVSFRANLTNIYRDGVLHLNVLDSMRNNPDTLFPIPGFTVHVEEIFTDETVLADEVIFPEFPRCFTYELYNYGVHTQAITSAFLEDDIPNLVLSAELPIILEAGERKAIQICYETEDLVRFRTRLIIGNECLERPILDFLLTAYIDSVPPVIVVDTTDCDDFIIDFIEEGRDQIGVAGYEVIQNINTTVEDLVVEQRLWRIAVRRTNPRLDAFFTIVVRDTIGNTDTVSGIMPGFTLRAIDPEGRDLTEVDFGEMGIGSFICDNVTVLNFGNFPITLRFPDILINEHFSSMLSEFPITIPPGERRFVPVCFRPTDTSSYLDTLFLSAFCESEAVALLGRGLPLLKLGDSRCEAAVQTISFSVPFRFFVYEPFPNPNDGSFTIKIDVPERRPLHFAIYSLQGQYISGFEQPFDGGSYQLDVDTSTLSPGMYFATFRVGEQVITKKVIVR